MGKLVLPQLVNRTSAGVVRDSNSGYQLLLPHANCPHDCVPDHAQLTWPAMQLSSRQPGEQP